MTKYEIIEQLANERRVETLVENITRQALSPNLKDLAQMVYVILLEYDEDKVIELWENNEINFFIVRIITNQYHSCNSPYFALFRRFNLMVDESMHLVKDAVIEKLDIMESTRVLNEDQQ